MSGLKKTILIVDDAPDIIELIGNLLKERFNVLAASNGNVALKIVNTAKIDLILLDIMMPVLNGYDVCKKIKGNEKTRHIPVIFLTGKGEIEDKMKGIELGGSDYITKPVDTDYLKEIIKKYIKE